MVLPGRSTETENDIVESTLVPAHIKDDGDEIEVGVGTVGSQMTKTVSTLRSGPELHPNFVFT